MIGLGKWVCEAKTVLFKQQVSITISDKNGEYAFDIFLIGTDVPSYQIKSINEQGNTLSVIAMADAFKGKDIPINITFEGNKCSGFLTVPVIGKVKFNGTRTD